MKKIAIWIACAASLFGTTALQAADNTIGFVNFKACVEKSKQGQQEKGAFESLKKQMGETMEKTDKELADLAKKLEDQEYMDGLSPVAEQELKQRFQTLSQEFGRYQNQYYQLLNQANYRMLQNLHDTICKAAEAVRAKHHLNLIINEDSTFASATSLNFTDEVVAEMDKQFESENTNRATASRDGTK